MILEKINIKDYKSISELEWILNDGLSCLVGQNESGKSNLLEVFDFIEGKEAKKLNFETHTNRSSESYNNQKLPTIIYHFKFTEESKNKFLEKLNKGKIETAKHGGIENLTHYIIEIDESQGENQNIYFLWNGKKVHPKSLTTISLQNRQVGGRVASTKREVTINQQVLTNIVRDIDSIVPNRIKLNDQDFKITFNSTLENIKNGSAKNTSIFKLMKIAGLNNASRIPSGRNQIRQYLRGLNRKLNKEFVHKYYSQDNSVRLEFVHDSGEISVDIEDNSDGTYIMEERSDGFKYFFSLLIEMASNLMDNENVYFLLDEPGGRLHPSGQRDLLKYLEELADKHKIIYTTHSPFLINRLYPNRVRIVARDPEKGTVFKFKGFSKNWKPMRSSLGLNIKDSFYYSDKALIVEGPEDLIFISSLIEYFNRIGELDLNTDLFSFIDAGGESNLPAMVQIIMDDERPTLVLIDSDSVSTYNKLNKKVNAVGDSSILDLIQVNEFKKEAISIEDLLPYQLLQNAVKLFCAELELDGTLKKKKQTSNGHDASAIATAVMAVASEVASSIATLPIDLSKISSSRYNTSIAHAVKNFYNEVDLEEVKWNNKKTPISKVGIARHFELLLQEDKIDKSKMDFKPSLKLVETIAKKLGLLS
ncbi:ATP-dependent nuclease [Xanthomarina sp. F2636L]|uniref:ATP-dependent nuclease n=1 Tax=Xanthomarina sp. F2636L TaxID=2996018 RepID=UPI00225E1216|nr:AAA family ATPase [Xanthomarina sp. F2636L]MCX7550274.1 AAA family ATPase [Xanthomarina sp. F2636L]